jgi:hypothetical protein
LRKSAVIALVAALGLIAVLALRRKPDVWPVAPAEPSPVQGPPVEQGEPDPLPEPTIAPAPPAPPKEPEEVVLRATVHDASARPLSGVHFAISAKGQWSVVASGEGLSGEDGTFVFRAPGGAVTEFALSLKSSGYSLRSSDSIPVRRGSREVRMNIVVATQELVRIVVKADGAGAIPFARIDWWRGSRRKLQRSGGTADIEGAFQLPVDFGGSTVSAVAPGFGRGFLNVPSPLSMEIVLKPVPTVHGVLLDCEGAGLGGARLDITLRHDKTDTDVPHELDEETAITELNGQFVLKSITPRAHYGVRVASSAGTALELEQPAFRGHADTTLVLRIKKPK